MLQHTLLFSFPDGGPSAEQSEQIRTYIREWPDAIPGIRALRFGAPMFDDRIRGYQFLLHTEFDDVASMRAYQEHPVHQRFLAWVIENNITPLAFDFMLDNETVLLPR
jgi:hypothetical protein